MTHIIHIPVYSLLSSNSFYFRCAFLWLFCLFRSFFLFGSNGVYLFAINKSAQKCGNSTSATCSSLYYQQPPATKKRKKKNVLYYVSNSMKITWKMCFLYFIYSTYFRYLLVPALYCMLRTVLQNVYINRVVLVMVFCVCCEWCVEAPRICTTARLTCAINSSFFSVLYSLCIAFNNTKIRTI